MSPRHHHEEYKTLTENLRKEANEVKDCFTKYSFQSIAISTVLIGLIIRFQMEEPLIGAAGVLVIGLVVYVARLGIYKYGTANRIFGYELYLDRIKYLPDSHANRWKSHIPNVGWEEGLQAWRIVQATVYEHIYEEAPFVDSIYKHLPTKYREHGLYKLLTRVYSKKVGWKKSDWGTLRLNSTIENIEYKWVSIDELLVNQASYHSGTYLKSLLKVLFLLSYFSLLPILISCLLYFFHTDFINFKLGALFGAIFVVSWLFVFSRSTRSDSRREILEDGLLSIHSCAIMWQAVMITHFRALQKLSDHHQPSMKGYIKELSQQTRQLIVHGIKNIHSWTV